MGTSGYQYDHWRGRFYPAGLPKVEWLPFYAGRFDTLEINTTFYGLPTAATFDKWRQLVPHDFLYAIKFSRYGSHLKHLKDPEETVGRFLDVARHLGATLGPILVQLPPRWRVNIRRLSVFLEAAPMRYRWAVEFRDPSWLCEDVFDVLRSRNAALCIHDLISDHPVVPTADWVYIRYHGAVPGRRYGRRRLSAKAGLIEDLLSRGLDVFAYFNNDVSGFAVRDALLLKELLSG